MSKPPPRLAMSVPKGSIEAFNAMPKPQRSHAPSAAPPPTASHCIKTGGVETNCPAAIFSLVIKKTS